MVDDGNSMTAENHKHIKPTYERPAISKRESQEELPVTPMNTPVVSDGKELSVASAPPPPPDLESSPSVVTDASISGIPPQPQISPQPQAPQPLAQQNAAADLKGQTVIVNGGVLPDVLNLSTENGVVHHGSVVSSVSDIINDTISAGGGGNESSRITQHIPFYEPKLDIKKESDTPASVPDAFNLVVVGSPADASTSGEHTIVQMNLQSRNYTDCSRSLEQVFRINSACLHSPT